MLFDLYADYSFRNEFNSVLLLLDLAVPISSNYKSKPRKRHATICNNGRKFDSPQYEVLTEIYIMIKGI